MKIGVIMGGVSAEREVSLNTGKEMVANLDSSKYEIIPMKIDHKEEVWEKAKEVDFVLLALHGTFGEDGAVQSILETLGKPYSGCGPLSSGLCMDKDLTKKLIRAQGVNTADWITVRKNRGIPYDKIEKLGYPVVVKPNSGGSSVATYIIHREEEIKAALESAFQYDKEVMVEQYIKGEEITCPILNGKMFPILAISTENQFFDYEAKYSDQGAKEEVIEFAETLQKKIEGEAVKCYEVLKCEVYARVDMIVKEGVPYVLEINTLPGMTKNSLFPKSAKAVGIPFTRLMDLIIEYSLEK